jgi:hypothetical protein
MVIVKETQSFSNIMSTTLNSFSSCDPNDTLADSLTILDREVNNRRQRIRNHSKLLPHLPRNRLAPATRIAHQSGNSEQRRAKASFRQVNVIVKWLDISLLSMI